MNHSYIKLFTFLLLLVAAPSKTLAQTPDTLDIIKPQKVRSDVINAFTANASIGWIASRVTTPVGSYTWRGGAGYELSYRRIGASGYGVDFAYAHSQTNFPTYSPSVDYKLKFDQFIASILYGGRVGRASIAAVGIGVGYALYNDDDERVGAFTYRTMLDLEYLLSSHLGIGLGADYTMLISSKQNVPGYSKKENEVNGFKRLTLKAGIRIHL